VPADREVLLGDVAECVRQLTGASVHLQRIPQDCPLLDLEQHGLSIDSIQLLELVVLLEERVGRELELPAVTDDWSSYTWGRLLDDLAAAVGDTR